MTFEELGVSVEIRQAIEEMGFVQPMPVQEEVIPRLLTSQQDMIALAQTGTGKTASFGIPLLMRLDLSNRDTQALVLSPTRELCLQIADDLREFSKYMDGVHVEAVYGGAAIESQIRSLKKGAQVIVATPGRLIDLKNRGYAKLESINNIVLDEADEMLNMGFSDAINEIFDSLPAEHSTLMFSALETQEIADKLIRDGYNAESLHGDLSQQQRDLTMQKFRQHLTQLLVATDVAARGLDVDDLTHVINFGLPDDIENYTHRSGRTGRAGKKGTSISIVHSKEKHKIREIEKEIGKQFVETPIPSAEEICKKQLYKVMDQIVKTDVDDEEIAPFMQDISRYFEYIDKEEIIKKIVSLEFGKFLAYYADAPEIEKVEIGKRKEDRMQTDREKRMNKAQKGYTRLFINLGKKDGFFPGVLMQTLNRYVGGRQEVGHIDLLDTISYFEVPEKDARKVMSQLTGIRYKGRTVRCNSEDDKTHGPTNEFHEPNRAKSRNNKSSGSNRSQETHKSRKNNDWRSLMNASRVELKGEEPDFSEEGWARRKPKKKK